MTHACDILVIGGGAAGMAAAIMVPSLGMRATLLESSPFLGGQLRSAANRIENYPGIVGLTGPELVQRLQDHLETLKVPVFLACAVSHIDPVGRRVVAECGEFCYQDLIVAVGLTVRRLGLAGEDRMAGVSYSATADGQAYAGKTVAIVGGGDNACEEALMLAEICPRVHLIHRRRHFKARADFVARLACHPRITQHTPCVLARLTGQGKITGGEIAHLETGQRQGLTFEALFVRIGFDPNTACLAGLLPLDDDGGMIIDQRQATSLAHVWAIGDCVLPVSLSVAHAVGQAAAAARHLLMTRNAAGERSV